MLYKSSILNAPEMAEKRPRVTQRRPRASQPLPKWSPRPSQIHLLRIFFWILDSHTKFAWIFHGFLFDFCKLESLKIAIFPWKNNDFYKIAILSKNTKNHRKTIPKSSRNPSKIDKKSEKIEKKRPRKPSWRKMCPKSPQNAQKMQKMSQHSPESRPQGGRLKVRRSPRCPVWPCLEFF